VKVKRFFCMAAILSLLFSAFAKADERIDLCSVIWDGMAVISPAEFTYGLEMRYIPGDRSSALYKTFGIYYPSIDEQTATAAVTDASAAEAFLSAGVIRPAVSFALSYYPDYTAESVPFDTAALVSQDTPYLSAFKDAFFTFEPEDGSKCCLFPAYMPEGSGFCQDTVYLVFFRIEHGADEDRLASGSFTRSGDMRMSCLIIADQQTVISILVSLSDELNAIDSAVQYTPLQNGSKGNDVKKLQQKLTDLGLLESRIDGDFGDKTRAAVSKYQRRNGLEQTGIADQQTLSLLYRNERPLAVLNDWIAAHSAAN